MNRFAILDQEEKVLLSFMSDRPPSLDNKYLVLSTLDRLSFSEIHYVIRTIPISDRNRSFKFEGKNKKADEFMDEFLRICGDGNSLFGVELYLK